MRRLRVKSLLLEYSNIYALMCGGDSGDESLKRVFSNQLAPMDFHYLVNIVVTPGTLSQDATPSLYFRTKPQSEPAAKAFNKYKEYLSEVKDWTCLYEKCFDEALSLVEELDQELQSIGVSTVDCI